MMIEITL